ncbi:hypothetical protein Csa_009739 [Cucumis sativus]|uniref:Putative plant transposon protein domain-containing protein n=1 Tax=Cucumis sativus TaxID=3659 RepID=A0A0A0LAN0_CUCSA|nr:hypothetical protein Csa_009739 [Cucumis sativus]
MISRHSSSKDTNRKVSYLHAQFEHRGCIWLVLIKKKIMPTRHVSTISMERVMLVYCIMKKILVNIGKIISNHIIALVKHPRGARPFSYLIEQLCLRACLMLEKLPQVEVKDGIWLPSTLHRIIAIHKNKAKIKCLKTKEGCKVVKEIDDDDVEEEDKKDNIPQKRKRQDKEDDLGSKKAKSSKIEDS